MKNILIYSNCAGNVLKTMFLNHDFTKNEFNVESFYNYENLHKNKLSDEHLLLLKNCDIFIYQPMNNSYNYSEYDIKYILTYLNKKCLILRVNYYRFKGFWYNCNYIPYKNYNNYSFHELINSNGMFNDLKNLKNIYNKNDVVKFIDNIEINKHKIVEFFLDELEKIKLLDQYSDVKMYDFFKQNYKNKLLFYECYHPTNIFFYEIFRQLVFIISSKVLLQHDNIFLQKENIKNVELTHWTVPILPIVKTYLELNLENIVPCFNTKIHEKKIYMDVYDNYYIRLSPQNFKKYLEELNL